MKKTFAVILCVVMVAALGCTAYADGPDAMEPVKSAGRLIFDEIIDMTVEIVGTVLMTAVGLFGAWALKKIGNNAKLNNINAAFAEAVQAATQTVAELQQRVVEGLKAQREDGKLTGEDIKALNAELIALTVRKMSTPAVELLRAAKVDLNAYILGAGEKALVELKNQEENKAA